MGRTTAAQWTADPTVEEMHDQRTVEELHEVAAQLCRDYATCTPTELRERGRRLLAHVNARAGRTESAAARRDLLVVSGWTSLLVACVEYDLDLDADAERSRRQAGWVGREAGHDEIVAWAFELGAWFAVTRRRWRRAIDLAVAGQLLAPNTSAAVQLAAQEARAWARLGERRGSEAALTRGERTLERLPNPRESDHHFVIDEPKIYSYRLDCYRWLGDDLLTRRYADEVLARWDQVPPADRRKPMRVSAAQLSLGVVAARAGDLDAASAAGLAALSEPRRCLPWFTLLTGELLDAVLTRWPADARCADLVEQARVVAPAALPPCVAH
jgi:hypothetical protein